MKKNSVLFAGTILAVVLLVAAGISTRSNPVVPVQSTSTASPQSALISSIPAPAQTSTPFTGEVIRLAWFYKPPVDDQLDFIADNFDFFILTHKDENERNKLKADGLEMPISQYLLFLVINDPGGCDEEPNGNQVAYKTGDFCSIDEQHPEWFLVDNSGNRIKSGKNSYYMDPGNEGYRAFWLERARELQESYGWENIFLDNVEASLAKMTNEGGTVAKYPDDESYQRAVEGFLEYIRRNYFEPRGKAIYGNIVSVREDAVWDRYLQYLDGALVESFATDWSDGYPSRKSWDAELTQSEKALAQGRTLILVAQGEQDDALLQNFAFASYLLIANGNAYFRYTNSDSYRELWFYENYDLKLGAPLGDRHEEKNEWRRDFENGYVTVNPENHKAQIVLTR
jgi:hypothetical protein